jgi:hypothetical protein
MDSFAAAKRAARERGIKTTEVQSRRELPAFLRPATLVKTFIFLVVVGGIALLGYHFFGPKPPRYLTMPNTAEAAVQQLLTHISAGTDPEYLAAYALIADSARNPRADDEKGDYQQLFHAMNAYLSGEFGNGWAGNAKLAADPADASVVVATVGVETLRIHTAQQTPSEKMSAYGPHYGVTSIDDFDVAYAAELRKTAVIEDIVGGIAGQGSLNDLRTVLGAGGPNPHDPKMIQKIGMLVVLRNPRTATARSTLQTYPLRADPVIRNRLSMVQNDARYDPHVMEIAKEILIDKVPEEELDAVGVPHN